MGERVRRFRIKRGITVNELAQNSNISRDAIISYENGQTEAPPKILLSIAAALSVNSDKLCDEYYRFLLYPYGKRIKGIRKGLGLTQQEFAETYGFTLTMVKRWEQGRNRVTREQWEKLSHISKPYVA